MKLIDALLTFVFTYHIITETFGFLCYYDILSKWWITPLIWGIEMKINFRKLIGLYGSSVCMGSTLTLLVDFFRAYFLHNTTTLIITFNDYGEAIPEMILFVTGIIALIWYLKVTLESEYLWKRRNYRRRIWNENKTRWRKYNSTTDKKRGKRNNKGI